LRLFVALDLPDDVVSALYGWSGRVAREGLRRLPPESLHVTLAFLGSRPDEEVDDIAAAVRACAMPVGALRLGAPAWLGRGSALAVDVVDGEGACARLQRDVSDSLAALGVYEPEERPFRPHVTVARVTSRGRPSLRGRERETPGPSLRGREREAPIPDAGPFSGRALTLYESRLSPRGASYAAHARVELPRP
jgi:2'-5' RNA ligase